MQIKNPEAIQAFAHMILLVISPWTSFKKLTKFLRDIKKSFAKMQFIPNHLHSVHKISWAGRIFNNMHVHNCLYLIYKSINEKNKIKWKDRKVKV